MQISTINNLIEEAFKIEYSVFKITIDLFRLNDVT